MKVPGTDAEALSCKLDSGVPSVIEEGVAQERLTSRLRTDAEGLTIFIEVLARPAEYLRVSSCVITRLQVPSDKATKLSRLSIEQIEAGPTTIFIGVLVFELYQIFCGGSSVVIAIGGTNSGFCGALGMKVIVIALVIEGAGE